MTPAGPAWPVSSSPTARPVRLSPGSIARYRMATIYKLRAPSLHCQAMVLAGINRAWRITLNQVEGFGDFVIFCIATLGWMAEDLFRPRRWRLVWPQMYEVGTKSIPIIMLTGSFIGMVLAVELFE